MGVTLSSLWNSLTNLASWGTNQDIRILMLGLDSAGKTTILYRLQVRVVFLSSRLCSLVCLFVCFTVTGPPINLRGGDWLG